MRKILIFSMALLSMFGFQTIKAKSEIEYQNSRYYYITDENHQEVKKELLEDIKEFRKQYKALQKELRKEGLLHDDLTMTDDLLSVQTNPSISLLAAPSNCELNPEYCIEGEDGGGDSNNTLEVTSIDFLAVPCTKETYVYCTGIVETYSGSITTHEMKVSFNPSESSSGKLWNTLYWHDAPHYSYEDYMGVFVDSQTLIKLETFTATTTVNYESHSHSSCSYPVITNLTYTRTIDYTHSEIDASVAGEHGAIMWTIDEVYASETSNEQWYGDRPYLPSGTADPCYVYQYVNNASYQIYFEFKMIDGNPFQDRGSLSFSSEYAHRFKRYDVSLLGTSWSSGIDWWNATLDLVNSYSFEYDSKRRLDIRVDF